MKKILFFAATAALTLASCSNDETTAVKQAEAPQEISFRALTNNVTRSTAGPVSMFKNNDVINVWADFYDASSNSHTKHFQADFTKSDGTSETGFSSTQKYYWPTFDTDDKITFTAIYGGTQSTSTVGKVENFSPNTTATDQMDLMVARKELTAKVNPVVLNFRHALSQIIVKVKNTDANLDFDVTGVRIGYVNTQGEFNYDYNYNTSTPETGSDTSTQESSEDASAGNVTSGATLVKSTNWNLTVVTDAKTNKYDQTFDAVAISGNQAERAITGFNPWLLLPQTQTAATAYTDATQGTASADPTLNGSYIALELTIYNYASSTRGSQIVAKQWCYWPCSFTWNPGYKYTYTVNLAGGGYQPINCESAATSLNLVLGNVIVFSPYCTVDNWIVSNVQ